MNRTAILTVAVWLAAAPAFAQGQGAPPTRAKAPWGALTDIVGAGEIVLGRVCLPGIVEHQAIPDLAYAQWLVAMPPKAAGATPADKAWRLASLTPVYAVAWGDGSCSTFVDRGPSAKLREMADRTIRARPEGFVLDQTGVVAGGSVERTIYCGGTAGARYVATIATPVGHPAGHVRALASTVYRAGPTGLCSHAAPVAQPDDGIRP